MPSFHPVSSCFSCLSFNHFTSFVLLVIQVAFVAPLSRDFRLSALSFLFYCSLLLSFSFLPPTPDSHSSTSYHFYYSSLSSKSWDSSVGIATGYGLEYRWVGVPSVGRVTNFLFSTSSRPALEPTQPPIQWVPGAFSPGVKRQVREADHSPPTSAEVKKTWIYECASTPPYAFMA
jgi:hypothetical protein